MQEIDPGRCRLLLTVLTLGTCLAAPLPFVKYEPFDIRIALPEK